MWTGVLGLAEHCGYWALGISLKLKMGGQTVAKIAWQVLSPDMGQLAQAQHGAVGQAIHWTHCWALACLGQQRCMAPQHGWGWQVAVVVKNSTSTQLALWRVKIHRHGGKTLWPEYGKAPIGAESPQALAARCRERLKAGVSSRMAAPCCSGSWAYKRCWAAERIYTLNTCFQCAFIFINNFL